MTGASGGGGGETIASATAAVEIPFRPSRDGFHFANRFPPGPTVRLGPLDPRLVGIGDAKAGLCGGMAFTARDLWEHRVPPPPDREPPPNGSRRFVALVRRQVHSLDLLRVPLRFWVLAALHRDPPTWWSRALRRTPLAVLTRDVEWPRIRAEIDGGQLAQVGLIREVGWRPNGLTRNHQVLAYGYRRGPTGVAIRIYDPNWPDGDDVELRLDEEAGSIRLSQSTGEPLHGFFLAPYRPENPRAWGRPA